MDHLKQKILHTPEEAESVAREFAKTLKGNECILCSGPMGIGKSVIIRAALRALGATATNLPSPTFTLIESYSLEGPQAPCREALHIDLYRLLPDDEGKNVSEEADTIETATFMPENTSQNEMETHEFETALAATATAPATDVMTRDSLEAMALLELQDILESRKLVFIEWGDQLEELRPYATYILSLNFAPKPLDQGADSQFKDTHTVEWHLQQLTPTVDTAMYAPKS